jgi:hypothetical protein
MKTRSKTPPVTRSTSPHGSCRRRQGSILRMLLDGPPLTPERFRELYAQSGCSDGPPLTPERTREWLAQFTELIRSGDIPHDTLADLTKVIDLFYEYVQEYGNDAPA